MIDKDPIVSMSQMAGDPGLDSPRSMPKTPDEPVETFSELFKDKKTKSKSGGETAEPTYKAHARVFLIDSAGNSDYEDILNKGLSGEIVLGKREVCDIKGSADFKVYLEWMVPVVAKKKG